MTIESGPGAVHVSVAPVCPTHGAMHYSPGVGQTPEGYSTGRFICHGYDGEGCDYTAEIEWHYLGTADSTNWRLQHGEPE